MYKAKITMVSFEKIEIAPTGYPHKIGYTSYSTAYGNTIHDALNIAMLDCQGTNKHIEGVHIEWVK